MERLTETVKYPLTTFLRCQICGVEDPDICKFSMWVEHDDNDRPESFKVLVVCRSKACKKVITKHPRLYGEAPWSAQGPGRFMLLCGDYRHRDGTKCTHPSLKANGGEGLDLEAAQGLGIARVCFTNGTGMTIANPFVGCTGHQQATRLQRIMDDGLHPHPRRAETTTYRT